MSYIVIGADLVPTNTNMSLFEKGDINQLCGNELLRYLNEAAYRVFNLEVPLTDIEEPIDKCGPHLKATEASIKGIKMIGADLFGLANNHCMDQGWTGLKRTIELLDVNKIAHIGAGKSLEEARAGRIVEINEKRIGFYCCAEHEFSIAEDETPGANPFDPLYSLDHVEDLKSQCDYLIVLYHGGKELYRYPSPDLQKTCRRIIEKGADLIVCQHSHCIGCKEEWDNGTIVYGQGNFLFDHSVSEYWKTSLIISIDLDNEYAISYQPIIKDQNVVRIPDPDGSVEILNQFNERSKQIIDGEFVRNQYTLFANEMYDNYMQKMSGNTTCGILFRIINKLTQGRLLRVYLSRKYKKQNLLAIQNYLMCEAHRELVINCVKNGILKLK